MMKLISKNRPYFNRSDLFAILKFGQRGNIKRFEKRFAEFVNAKYALSFPYARSAIWALLKIWEGAGSNYGSRTSIVKSDFTNKNEVIVSAYTCTVVAHAVIKAGFRPRFVDIELDSYNPKIDEILAVVSDKTKAIITVHTFGNVMDLDRVVNNLPRKDVLIIEDSALCPKPVYKNEGYKNIVSIYSLGHTKHFSTVEGGMVATDNEEIYKKLLEFRNKNFRKADLFLHFKNFLHFFIRYFIFGKTGYYFLDALKNLKMLEKFYDERSMNEISLPKDFNVLFSEWQARLGLNQLGKASEILEKRRKIAEFYYNELKDFHSDVISQPIGERRSDRPTTSLRGSEAQPLSQKGLDEATEAILQKRREVEIASRHAPLCSARGRNDEIKFLDGFNSLWSHYPVRIIGRDAKLIREKMKQKGIEAGVTFDYSLPVLPIFREYRDRELPNSKKAASEMINLPNYPSLSNKETAFIIQTLKDILKSA